MITKIEVDGFKSLSEFKLKLRAGLNIFVGPNGAGKTNIILFFEFLSKMVRNPIAYAVSSVGGAGAIFKKIRKEEYQDTISFKIYGCHQTDKNSFIVYEFSGIIKSSFTKDDIFFIYQEIKVRTATKFWSDPDEIKGRTVWDFHLEYKFTADEKHELIIHELNTKKFKPRYFFNPNGDDRELHREFKEFVMKNDPSTLVILTALFPVILHSDAMINDILGGESFNVVPSKVKEQEDAATPPGIKKDGSGLSTTLYALKKSKPVTQDYRYRIRYERNERTYEFKTLKKIISYLKLANKTIINLDVENDPFDNKLIVKIFIQTGTYEAVLPLSSMSDGTIKWLTLITAILTSKTIFSIEEPENFLHPWMQAEIANIMREHIESKNNQSFVIMTTHSESLLNHSNPEEIILIDLIEGKTSARRISNVGLLQQEISQSGFGLGHFYFSDSFNHD